MVNPRAFPDRNGNGGMTLRDYFAAAALQGYRASGVNDYPEAIADLAGVDADAMLAERAKEVSDG